MPSKPQISIENRANLMLLSKSGHSQREVATMVGCSQKSVAEILRKQTDWLGKRHDYSG